MKGEVIHASPEKARSAAPAGMYQFSNMYDFIKNNLDKNLVSAV